MFNTYTDLDIWESVWRGVEPWCKLCCVPQVAAVTRHLVSQVLGWQVPVERLTPLQGVEISGGKSY